MAIAVGQRLGPYEVLSPLGAGGMGEVYRARDHRLGRDVAIKVLPAGVARDPDRLARFEREARALAALSHPNILVIHDFAREGDITYVVTELLEGETLRHRVGEGALPWRQAVETGAAIADALSAAHAAGIVHRDLKPENVFLTRDGRVKVLDFGLAKVQPAPPAEADTVTSPPQGTVVGAVLGTVGYMSPEQVRGEPADPRSDIFAFGCVLYEMLTGRRAFGGAATVEVLSAILKEQPQEITLTHPEVNPELDRIVSHCLEKAPERRFQSAHDLAFGLRSLLTSSLAVRPALNLPRGRRQWIGAGVATAAALAVAVALLGLWKPLLPGPDLDRTKVVVAPFENRTGDPSFDAYGALISEAVTRDAALAGGMTVLPGTSFAGDGGSHSSAGALVAIARAHGAGLVVSGAYYLTGDDLRIQAQLFDPLERSVIVTFEPITGNSRDHAALLEPLRQRVLGAVACQPAAGVLLGLMHTPTLAAFAEYTRGTEFFGRDYDAAIACFRRAVEIDPDFALPRFLICSAHWNQGRCDASGRVLEELEGCLEGFTTVERLWVSAMRARHEGRWAEALDIWRQVERIASGKPGALVVYLEGLCELRLNRPRSAAATLTRAMDLAWSPRAFSHYWPRILLASAHHMTGNYEAELAVAEGGLRDTPDILSFYSRKAAALAALGRLTELNRLIDETLGLRARAGSAGLVMRTAAIELRAHGHREAALAVAGQAVDWYRRRPAAEAAEWQESLLHALIQAERWSEAKAIANSMLAESPDEIDRLGSVGVLAARLGERADAERIATALRDRAPDCRDGEAAYWRACIATQLGDEREGMALLKDAMARGLGFDAWIHCDTDLEPLWGDPEFKELLRPKG